jgi:hypothetical protein
MSMGRNGSGPAWITTGFQWRVFKGQHECIFSLLSQTSTYFSRCEKDILFKQNIKKNKKKILKKKKKKNKKKKKKKKKNIIKKKKK